MGKYGFCLHYHAADHPSKRIGGYQPENESKKPRDSMEFSSCVLAMFQNHCVFETSIQTACKPGSVQLPKMGVWTAIPLGRVLPPASSNQPGRQAGNRFAPLCCHSAPAAPIRFCSRWGFPCPPRYRRGGALLPHPFTLTTASRGGLLSVALSLGLPPPAVSRHRIPVEPGLSSGVNHQRPSSRLDRRGARADYVTRQPRAALPRHGHG